MLSLGLAGWEGAAALGDRLRAAGYALSEEAPDVRLLTPGPMETEAVRAAVGRVLAGGALLVCGGEGPLLPALHLFTLGAVVPGPAEPAWPGLAPVEGDAFQPVSGVGLALYRAGERCVALAGQRGRGWVAYLGQPVPPEGLLLEVLRWISWQQGSGGRLVGWTGLSSR